ncbi:unnamed protein product [Phytophthora fragariaefolia]|uniref:Unnamed protein product n=1 Tax=Phytophthora fragariaefolia TaxID=1490495 RepID=A0A9W6X5S6_9STRA|nr:unnamed protein product [Phytophthora fragariaefolia]
MCPFWNSGDFLERRRPLATTQLQVEMSLSISLDSDGSEVRPFSLLGSGCYALSQWCGALKPGVTSRHHCSPSQSAVAQLGLGYSDNSLALPGGTQRRVFETKTQHHIQSCHDSLEGGHQGIVRTFHRVKADYYWIGLYADVERHVRSCPDCSSSKSRPQLQGYSPGNILAERPLQIVSLDFVIPLPKSRRGNTALLLLQCVFTGFGLAKAMSDTSALCVAQAFEECVYRRFGPPSLVRHDRDPRFMSEVFHAFAEMMQYRSRATLIYRPQANGQLERSVKTVMQSVRVYAEDPLQQDWDTIVERLVFAINNSQDTTQKETPFYLVHGWDAQSTIKAMASSLKRGFGR